MAMSTHIRNISPFVVIVLFTSILLSCGDRTDRFSMHAQFKNLKLSAKEVAADTAKAAATTKAAATAAKTNTTAAKTADASVVLAAVIVSAAAAAVVLKKRK